MFQFARGSQGKPSNNAPIVGKILSGINENEIQNYLLELHGMCLEKHGRHYSWRTFIGASVRILIQKGVDVTQIKFTKSKNVNRKGQLVPTRTCLCLWLINPVCVKMEYCV